MNLPSILVGGAIAAAFMWCIRYNLKHRDCTACGGSCGGKGCRCQETAARLIANAKKQVKQP